MTHDDAVRRMKNRLRLWGYPADAKTTRLHYYLKLDEPGQEPFVSMQFQCHSAAVLRPLMARIYRRRRETSAFRRLYVAQQERGMMSLLGIFDQDHAAAWELGIFVSHAPGIFTGKGKAETAQPLMELVPTQTASTIEVLVNKAYRSIGVSYPERARTLGVVWGRFLRDLESELEATAEALVSELVESLERSGETAVTDEPMTAAA